jgi:outer membrane protein assembly factor BamB
MSTTRQTARESRRPIRLWPGVIAALLLALVRFVVPAIVPEAGGVAILGGLAGAMAIVLWWLFFSRAPWVERVGAVVLMAGAVAATSPLVHVSIRGGMMGMMLPIYAIPLASLALVAGAVAGRRLPSGPRRALITAAILLACGSLTLVQTGGMTGHGQSDLHWRWTATPEQLLLASETSDRILEAPAVAASPSDPPAAETAPGSSAADTSDARAARPVDSPPASALPTRERDTDVATDRREGWTVEGSEAEWPGFRGPHRDSIVHGVRIATDWSVTPPIELWRRSIGPGWSSLAVSGGLVYTQEQRGEEEVVASYRLDTGEPVWRHGDPVRFWESNGGAGPRATPAVSRGRVYTLGATGIVNALDARTGARVWSRNAASDTGKEIPDWGFAGSPLVIEDLVVLALAGQLVAYDLATGAPRWYGREGGAGYSSPQFAILEGVPQILLSRGARTIAVSPNDGSVLWEHSWQRAVSILQPAVMPDGDVLIALGEGLGGIGMRRLAVRRGPDGWAVEERWTSRGLKPYFNDFVVHKGHAFGFDGSILACIDLADGERRWKNGRFGHGQLVLLADQDLLLVISEDGELGLVGAVPDGYMEIGRFRALEGKTWNHPVLVGSVLLVRNGEEMAAFRLAQER